MVWGLPPLERTKRREVFQKAYIRWLTKVSPEEARSILRSSDPFNATKEARKSLFIEMYQESWPDKVNTLRTCGLDVYWLKRSTKEDPHFAASVLEIELRRVDKLKAFSYEQCFRPDNVAERVLWLKKIDSEEFGDDPLINLTNVIHNSQGEEDSFVKLETLMKRRNELIELKRRMISASTPTPISDGNGSRPEPDSQ